MARFYGTIGFICNAEIAPGVWSDDPVEKPYYGDIVRNKARWESSGNVNDNFTISNDFSIVADDYAFENYKYMRYVKVGDTKWKITNIDLEYPRITLSVGGLYNG